MSEIIKPGDLKKASDAKEAARAQEILEADRRREEERQHLRQAFMERQLQPDGRERLQAALLAAAERGDSHLQIITFSSELCTDRGRAINNADPRWPETLVGYAERAYQFFETELQPQGYRLRAEILDFPGGMPGEVAITLLW